MRTVRIQLRAVVDEGGAVTFRPYDVDTGTWAKTLFVGQVIVGMVFIETAPDKRSPTGKPLVAANTKNGMPLTLEEILTNPDLDRNVKAALHKVFEAEHLKKKLKK